MQSFWEKDLAHYDVIIIGGGLVGLSTAASLSERGAKKVLVLERSVIPYGASTRNAGFACFGSLTEVLSDIQSMGEEQARSLLFDRWMGLQISRQRLGDEKLGFVDSGGYELVEDPIDNRLEQIDSVNGLVSDFLPNYLSDSSDLKTELGIHSEGRLIQMKDEAQLNPALFLASLEAYVQERGVVIRTGAEVKAYSETGDKVSVEIDDPHRGPVEVSASRLVIAVNAFAESLLGKSLLNPGRGQVFITEPIPQLKFKGNLHIDEGYYYFRNVGDRLLIGGARNLDFEQEATTEIGINDKIQAHLEQKSQEVFGLRDSFAVEMRWSGIMAFGENKQPLVERHGQRAYLALKMGGMGVALAGSIGEEVAELMLEDGL